MTRPVTTITRLVFPDQTNHHGTLFGGEALAMLAMAGSIAATRRARTPVVLANSGSTDFVAPVPAGSIVETRATVERVGRTSITVEATLEAENLLTGDQHRACTGKFIFVAVDPDGVPTLVTADPPSTQPESDDAAGAAAIKAFVDSSPS